MMTGAEPVVSSAGIPEPTGDRSDASAYQINLENFQGPLDLLLHLIKEQQINIYDIPIALITQSYLAYLDLMKELNINVAGDFLVMAATLVHIKSRTLLPVSADHADGLEDDEGEDPREELVRRLVEYQRYKEAASGLEQRAELWRECFARPADHETAESDDILLSDIQLFDLVGALQRVIARLPKDIPFVVTSDELSIKERMAMILDELTMCPSIDFFQLCIRERTRVMVIVTFLAVLELIRLQLMTVQSRPSEHGGELILHRSEPRGERERSFPEEVE